MERRLVDHGAPLFAAQVRGTRAERDDFVSGSEADAIGQQVAPLILQRDLLDRVRRLVELARPRGRGLDELARHVPVVAEVPGVHPGRGRGRERGVGGFGPGDSDAARFLGHLDRGVVGDPSHLVGQEHVARDGMNRAGWFGFAVAAAGFIHDLVFGLAAAAARRARPRGRVAAVLTRSGSLAIHRVTSRFFINPRGAGFLSRLSSLPASAIRTRERVG